MDHGAWERHCYIMDLFEADETMLAAREEFRELNDAVYAYAKTQPKQVQDMLFSYMTAFLHINVHLVTLACQHLRMPEEK